MAYGPPPSRRTLPVNLCVHRASVVRLSGVLEYLAAMDTEKWVPWFNLARTPKQEWGARPPRAQFSAPSRKTVGRAKK